MSQRGTHHSLIVITSLLMGIFIMSILKKPINYEGLEEELEEALRADTMYQLQNDAKLRALEQNVPTYEHFRQMVNGAHLKPLERKDTNDKCDVPWNSLSGTIRETNNQKLPTQKFELEISDYEKLSKTAQEFYQSWKEVDSVENKINFLLSTRDSLPTIFQVEIPTSILQEFLYTCSTALSTNKNDCSILQVLDALSSCNRFQLAITFMNDQDKLMCKQLFDKLADKVRGSLAFAAIINLAKKYQISIDDVNN